MSLLMISPPVTRLSRQHALHDAVAVDQEVGHRRCHMDADHNQQRPFHRLMQAIHRLSGRRIARSQHRQRREIKKDIDQPRNEANTHPVTVVANTSTYSSQCTASELSRCHGRSEVSGATGLASRHANLRTMSTRMTIPKETWNVMAAPGFMPR